MTKVRSFACALTITCFLAGRSPLLIDYPLARGTNTNHCVTRSLLMPNYVVQGSVCLKIARKICSFVHDRHICRLRIYHHLRIVKVLEITPSNSIVGSQPTISANKQLNCCSTNSNIFHVRVSRASRTERL